MEHTRDGINSKPFLDYAAGYAVSTYYPNKQMSDNIKTILGEYSHDLEFAAAVVTASKMYGSNPTVTAGDLFMAAHDLYLDGLQEQYHEQEHKLSVLAAKSALVKDQLEAITGKLRAVVREDLDSPEDLGMNAIQYVAEKVIDKLGRNDNVPQRFSEEATKLDAKEYLESSYHKPVSTGLLSPALSARDAFEEAVSFLISSPDRADYVALVAQSMLLSKRLQQTSERMSELETKAARFAGTLADTKNGPEWQPGSLTPYEKMITAEIEAARAHPRTLKGERQRQELAAAKSYSEFTYRLSKIFPPFHGSDTAKLLVEVKDPFLKDTMAWIKEQEATAFAISHDDTKGPDKALAYWGTVKPEVRAKKAALDEIANIHMPASKEALAPIVQAD